jgi:hypothetical protein
MTGVTFASLGAALGIVAVAAQATATELAAAPSLLDNGVTIQAPPAQSTPPRGQQNQSAPQQSEQPASAPRSNCERSRPTS